MSQGRVDRKEGGVGVGRGRWGGGKWGGRDRHGETGRERQGWGNGKSWQGLGVGRGRRGRLD